MAFSTEVNICIALNIRNSTPTHIPYRYAWLWATEDKLMKAALFTKDKNWKPPNYPPTGEYGSTVGQALSGIYEQSLATKNTGKLLK